jgi:hypothetical protein
VPAHLYTYSFEPNPEWSKRYAEGAEIQAYFEKVGRKYGVTEKVRFNEAVTDASYHRGKWTIKTSKNNTLSADFLISATGILHHPAKPHFDGQETFQGAMFHTAEWDHSVAPKGEAPKFLIQSVKDPDGANLDRVQVIKGWVDDKGERHEKIYDVAVSDGRKIGGNGRARTPVGSTVNVTEATYRNSIGEPQLVAYWADPDFDASQSAVYYARVLEIPTPTWQAYDSSYYRVKMPEQVPMTHQERAYTSPIWYTPQ